MKRWFILSPLAILLFPFLHPIAGADKPEDPGSLKTDAEYFPLKYGTAWTYNDKTSNQSFVVKVSAYEDLKVKQDDKEVTVRCALLETTVAGRKEVVGSELVGVSDDGVYRYRMGSDQLVEPPAKILSIPCKKGDTWKIDTKIQDKSVRLEYVVDEEEISIPGEAPDKPKKVAALKLKAKNFKVDDDEAQATLWYAKGIGMVKMEMQISGVSFILELEKFEPGS